MPNPITDEDLIPIMADEIIPAGSIVFVTNKKYHMPYSGKSKKWRRRRNKKLPKAILARGDWEFSKEQK